MSLENDLESIGLEEKEARVYLAALELGPTNIQNLAEKSSIKRSTVYEMLKKLEPMGLITESIKGKRKIYIASEPEKLKRSIREKEHLLNQILPELRSLNNTGTVKPKITYYEGREGLRQIHNISLEVIKKEASWVAPIRSIMETVGEDFLEGIIEKRAKEKYWVRSILVSDQQVETYKYLDPTTFDRTYRKIKFAPPGLNIPDAIGIWDNKVAVLSSRKEGFGFIIESEEYTNTMKVFYELLWSASKTYGELFDSKDKTVENKETNKEDDYWSVKK
jgi:HTH-type transcriptional regulator, sugar sensing transcriptional regulator